MILTANFLLLCTRRGLIGNVFPFHFYVVFGGK